MERQAEELVKQEKLKLYHKKINYGHKVMELYPPDQKITLQRDKINELRKNLNLHYKEVNMSDYDTHFNRSRPQNIRTSLVNEPLP